MDITGWYKLHGNVNMECKAARGILRWE